MPFNFGWTRQNLGTLDAEFSAQILMERTPFDEPLAPPSADAPGADVPGASAGDNDVLPAADDATLTAPLSRRRSRSRARSWPRWLWPALGAVILVLAMIGAGVWAGTRAENARLAALRERVNAIARNDNALVLEVLGADSSQNITYAEFFTRTAKNKADRDILVRKLRTLVAPTYQTEIDNLVRLLEIENDYVRAEEAVTRQKLETASRHDALQEIADANAPTGTLDSPYIAPSGDEIGGAPIEASREAGEAFRRYKAAREGLALKLNAATSAIDAWLDAEPQLYPNWAPPRDVTDALQTKKRRYNITAPDPNAAPNAPLNAAPDAPPATEFSEPPATASPAIEPTAEPTPEPTPELTSTPEAQTEPTPDAPETGAPASDAPATEAPVRVDATDAMAGERFPQTRQRALAPDELKSLSDEDLRYMTNEMFARYGLTFGDKSYQAQFERAPWYRPNATWSSAKIRRAFNDLEKSNLKLLIKERARRKSGG